PWLFEWRSDWYQANPKLPLKLGLAVPSDSCGAFSTVKTSKSRLGLKFLISSSRRSLNWPRWTCTFAVGVLPGAAKQFWIVGLFENRSNDVVDGFEPCAL